MSTLGRKMSSSTDCGALSLRGPGGAKKHTQKACSVQMCSVVCDNFTLLCEHVLKKVASGMLLQLLILSDQ